MKRILLLLLLAAGFVGSTAIAATAACDGKLAVATGPYEGYPGEVMAHQPSSSFHAAVQQTLKGQPEWLQNLRGVGGPVRSYTSGQGSALIVISVCQPHACPDHMLYGVWDAQTGTFGAMLWRNEQWQPLGTLGEPARAAIACATGQDNAEADKVRAFFDRTPLKAPWDR